MKSTLALILTLIALVSGYYRRNIQRNQHFNVIDEIKKYGYQVENHTVHTEDGFYLDLFRIPKGRKEPYNYERPAVLLMHGLISSPDEFVFGGPEQGLAFIMADEGFDVYLGSFRASFYGRRHSTLNPDRDPAFWNFGFQTLGTKDLPAIINKVLEISNKKDIKYVGHTEGATAFLIMGAQLPSYLEKVSEVVALGPLAYMGHSKNKIIKKIAENMDSKAWIMKHVGMNQFNPSSDLLEEAYNDCEESTLGTKNICSNVYFLLHGYQDAHYNKTTTNKAIQRLPAAASVQQILQLANSVKRGRFEKYIPDSTNREEYDLSKINVPVTLMYTPNDLMTHRDDVGILVQKLPNVKEDLMFMELDNNVDLLYAKNVADVVYGKIVAIFKNDW